MGGLGRIEDGGGGTWCILLQREIAPLTKILIKSYYLKKRYWNDEKLERGEDIFRWLHFHL